MSNARGLLGICFPFMVFCIEIQLSIEGPDQKLHFPASELGLHWLHMSPKQSSSIKQGQKLCQDLLFLTSLCNTMIPLMFSARSLVVILKIPQDC